MDDRIKFSPAAAQAGHIAERCVDRA